MIKVYHKKEPTFFAAREVPVDMADYHLVATCTTSDLEHAWTMTNSVNCQWWENAGVEFHGSPDHGMAGCRSTSVGDIMERNGKFHEVASAGFKPVEAK